jgi:crossover junction endodeoxyribonuclease RusA
MNEIKIIGPYPVSLNAYKKIVNNRLYRTKEANDFTEKLQELVREAGLYEPFDGFVEVDIIIYPKLTKTAIKLQKKDPLYYLKIQCLDVDNCLKVLLDSFNKIIYTDDKKIVKLNICKGKPYCVEGATQIIIKKIDESCYIKIFNIMHRKINKHHIRYIMACVKCHFFIGTI